MSPKLICHRGASTLAPENTLAAAKLALDKGAHAIELDVRESADGILYVLHDRTVDRTTNGSGLLELMHSSSIDKLDAGSWFSSEFEASKIPRLDVYLDYLKSRDAEAYIEIKWCNTNTLASVIKDTGMMENSFVFAHKKLMRDAILRSAPDLRHCITLSIARNATIAKDLFNASFLEIEFDHCRPGLINTAKDIGLQIIAYTESDDPRVFDSYLEAGVDYINHDHLNILLSTLGDTQCVA